MFKVFKILLGLAGLLVLAVAALPFFIDVNDYKDDISKAVHDATGRELHIEHIELSVFPWVGVRLSDVKLQNAPGFAEANMLQVQHVDIQLELIPLFSQRIEVKRFELDAPHIWLAQTANGQNNWSDLLESQQTATTKATQTTNTTQTSTAADKGSVAATTDSQNISFNAQLLRLSNGQVTWSDDVYGSVALSDIQLELHNLQLLEPISIDFSASVAGSPLEIHMDIGPIGDVAKLNVKKIPVLLRLQSKSLKLQPFSSWLPPLDVAQQAQVGALADMGIGFDISLEQHADGKLLSSGSVIIQAKHQLSATWTLHSNALKSLDLQSFKLSVDDTHLLALSGEVKNIPSKPSFELRLETANIQRLWLNQYLPMLQQLYSGNPKPWKSIKLSALIAGDQSLLDIRNLQLQLDNDALQVSGNVALGKAPDVQLRIAANTLHIDPWLPQSKETNAAKTMLADDGTTSQDTYAQTVAIEPDLRFLKPWYVSLQVNIQALHVLKLKLEHLKLTMSAEKGMIRLNPVRFDIGEGKMTETFTLNAKKYPVTWQESLRMSQVAVLPILKAVADVDMLAGIATLRTDMTGKGLLPDSIIKSLKGNGKFTFKDGQVKGVNIAQEIRKLQKTSNASATNNTDFAKMEGSFRVRNGIVSNKDLYMASPLFRLSGKGKLYLSPLKIDYHVRPKLIGSLAGQGGGVQKGLVVPLHISGPFDDLLIDVEMDRDALLESAAALNKLSGNKIGGVAGKVLDQGFVKTRDEEVKKAKARLQQQIAAEKARLRQQAEDKLKQQAEDKLKNALKSFGF